jgi:hypothetical protein
VTILAQANRLIKIAAPKVTREEDKRPEFRPATPRDAWAYFGMRPAPHQLENVERKTRFSVDVWHRRAGKSVSQIMKLLDRAAKCPLACGAKAVPCGRSFLQSTYRRNSAATDLNTGAADPDGLLGRLDPLGLTKVAVHPDDPFAAALDHPMGGRAARVIGR